MSASDIPEHELKLFRQVVWFVYRPGKTKPEGARLHLEGPEGPLKDYVGREATGSGSGLDGGVTIARSIRGDREPEVKSPGHRSRDPADGRNACRVGDRTAARSRAIYAKNPAQLSLAADLKVRLSCTGTFMTSGYSMTGRVQSSPATREGICRDAS
jgi:hypothetical protein